MGLTQITTGGVDDNINIDSNTLKVDGTNNRVGIGTSSPDALLHLKATSPFIRFTDSADDTHYAHIGYSDSSVWLIDADAGNAKANSAIQFKVDNSERMRINSAGNVGVGVASPQHILHLHKADSGTNYLQITNSTTGSTSTDGALFGLNSDEDVIVWQREANALQFGTNNAERMRINSLGNVGIGTATPLRALTISKTGSVISGTGNSYGFSINPHSNGYVYLDAITGGSANTSLSLRTYNNGTYTQVVQSISGNETTFETAGTERMRIDSSGRLLINTTNGVELIHGVGGGLKLTRNKTGNPSSGQSLMSVGFHGVNDTNSNAAAEAKIEAFAAENHSGTTAASNLRFYTKPSGTGPGSSPTERMRISSNGAVGIGTTSNSNRLRIHEGSDTPNVVIVTGADESSEFLALGVSSGVPCVTAGGVTSTSAALAFRTADNGTESEVARFDKDGRLLVGTTTNIAPDGFESKIQTAGTDYRGGSISIRRDQNSASGPTLTFTKSRSTVIGGTTVVQNGDVIAQMAFYGADGGDVNQAAGYFRCRVDGTPGGNDMPGRLELHTTADNAASPTERMRITSTGQLQSHSEGNTTLKPMQGCRAFCCLKGTGTVSVRSSFNVSALTDLGTGFYQITFSTAMIDSNYAVTTGFQRNAANDEFVNVGFDNTTTTCRFEFFDSGSGADCQRLTVAVYR